MPPGGALDIPLFLLVLTAPAMACERNDVRVWYTDEESDQSLRPMCELSCACKLGPVSRSQQLATDGNGGSLPRHNLSLKL
jgi:hypothetical protein